jgi:hypothetical protein
VSDARPITHVTDYVCGQCWNSFGRDEPGVVRGDKLVCPHCQHELPASGPLDIIAAVNAAPRRGDEGSDTFTPVDIDVAPVGRAVLSPQESEKAQHGWLPPDLLGGPASGFVAGHEDDAEDFGSAEPTLPPDASFAELLAAARDTAQGEEAAVDVNEPTPPADATAAEGERRDWKLKAMGLTYNFHGIDALAGWAANKAGQQMQVSLDGKVWKDFEAFFALYKSGMTPEAALAATGETDAAAAQPPPPAVDPLAGTTSGLGGRTQRTTQSRMAAAEGGGLGSRSATATNKAPPVAAGPASRKVAAVPAAAGQNDKAAKIAVAVLAGVIVLAVVLVKLGLLPIPGR